MGSFTLYGVCQVSNLLLTTLTTIFYHETILLKSDKMKRPKFLTVWLILIALFSLGIILVNVFDPRTVVRYGHIPTYPQPFMVIISEINLISVLFLLQWKKIGLYLMAVGQSVLIVITTGMQVIKVDETTPWLLLNIACIGIFYLAMRPVWNQFK